MHAWIGNTVCTTPRSPSTRTDSRDTWAMERAVVAEEDEYEQEAMMPFFCCCCCYCGKTVVRCPLCRSQRGWGRGCWCCCLLQQRLQHSGERRYPRLPVGCFSFFVFRSSPFRLRFHLAQQRPNCATTCTRVATSSLSSTPCGIDLLSRSLSLLLWESRCCAAACYLLPLSVFSPKRSRGPVDSSCTVMITRSPRCQLPRSIQRSWL